MEAMDEKLVSSWYNVHALPDSYVHPPYKRPGNYSAPPCKNIPVIDIGLEDKSYVIQEIMKASEEYGFFQVINHQVSKDLMDDARSVFRAFHEMPAKEKIQESSRDPNKQCKLYTSSENYANEKAHYWKDSLRHSCFPDMDEHMQYWPQKPTRYREVVGRYAVELRKLGSEILELMSEGLGLSPGYFCGPLSEDQMVIIHHYPPCPDPSLTLGLTKHRDPSLITILLQGDVKGLQVYKDGEWIGVHPIPYAFVVNIGYILQIISNGKFLGAEHRAVTNSKESRTTCAYFFYPSSESIVEPARSALVELNDQIPIYKSMKYKEFYEFYMTKGGDAEAMEKFISYT